MHDFVRETSLTTEEWMYANLNASVYLFGYSIHCVGRQLISSARQGRCVLISAKVCFNLVDFFYKWYSFLSEFILLSDTLGVSALVDSINNAKPPGATEATVLGPFYTEDAHESKDSIIKHSFF